VTEPPELSDIERAIHNDGERLIPGVTHDPAELARHRSSYVFFRRVIKLDALPAATVVDLGCGVGHGCVTLADLPNVKVLGMDVSEDSIEFARTHFARPNIEYRVSDLRTFLEHSSMSFDYAVSRNALEHVPNGIELAVHASWRSRLLFDVPYDEAPGVNKHHVMHRITEKKLVGIEGAEVAYQDLAGAIHRDKPHRPNVIVCVVSRDGYAPMGPRLAFPIPPWHPVGGNA
jgi:SAM-dependent methyltransferase